MKKTEIYEFNLPEGSDPAEIEKINENMVELDRILSAFLLRAHPIGSLYWSSDPTDPSEIFGGTWVPITDKFVLAAGNTYSNGATGGSADSVNIAHTHTISGSAANNGAHTHTVTGTAGSSGAHTHSLSGSATSGGAHTHGLSNGSTNSSGSHQHAMIVVGTASSSGQIVSDSGTARTSKESRTPLVTTSDGSHSHKLSGSSNSGGAHTHSLSGSAASGGAHTHSVSGTAGSNGAHTHTVSGTAASSGVSGAGKNMPPYVVKYCWERTA